MISKTLSEPRITTITLDYEMEKGLYMKHVIFNCIHLHFFVFQGRVNLVASVDCDFCELLCDSSASSKYCKCECHCVCVYSRAPS